MLRTVLDCFVQSWSASYRVRMLSAGLDCSLEGWNAF
jgi:hypothetical protein